MGKKNMNYNIGWAEPQEKGIMRHRTLLAWIAIAAVVALSVFAGLYMKSHNDNGTIPEGTYGINGIEYLTGISSSTPDYFLENNQGTTFAFYGDEFYITSEGAFEPSIRTEAFSDVTYEGIPLGNVLNLIDGVDEGLDLSKYTEKKAFRIFSKNVDTGYTLYRFDDEIWISYMHPNSNLQYVEYLFSLQMDELQNQSAAEILSILKAADFPMKEPVLINEENDQSGLFGTAHGYISKAEWVDSRGAKPEISTVTIEVFKNAADCAQRKASLENLYAYMSSTRYYYFTKGSVLIIIQDGLTENQAAIYGDALQAIRKGEMPKH